MSGGTTISRRSQAQWPWLSVLPLGLGAWVPIYAGLRAQRRMWSFIGILLTIAAIAGWALSIATNGNSGVGGGLIILAWVGAAATSFSIRPAYIRMLDSSFESARETAERRLSERVRAQQLARQRPELALEMGIGRPDLPGAHDGGVIDLNNASRAALMRLPRVDKELATEILETREKIDGFSSVDDLGAQLDLDGNVVEDLRDHVVFLPRRRRLKK